MDAKNLAERYSTPNIEWSRVQTMLDAGIAQGPGDGGPDRHTCWLATINPDGRPHVTAVGALWAEGCFWFETGERTRKGLNLARDPRCTLSVATVELDLVVEGTARVVNDPEVVARRAAQWVSGGWPTRVDESGVALTADYSAPSAGSPPWRVYRLEITAATAVLTVEPGGATRWTAPE